jgi:8-oxo-dGTP pyrophosphatase MutT (NUDIX family)
VTDTPATPRPSAAVVLLREREGGGVAVFMVRRHVRSEFVPDVYVFPGGSVKEADMEAERAPGQCALIGPHGDDATGLGAGFRAAALRECFEEAGVLLARRGEDILTIGASEVERFARHRDGLNNGTLTLGELAGREGLTLATDELLHWSHWVTPEAWPRRFDTHFFLAAMPHEQEAAHEGLEVTASAWVTPEEALAGYARGDFPLVFATEHQLRALTNLPSIAAAFARFSRKQVSTMRPQVLREDGQDVIVLPGGDEQ